MIIFWKKEMRKKGKGKGKGHFPYGLARSNDILTFI
jgi:hypothetical protein